MRNYQISQSFHYRKNDGALLKLCPIIDWAEVDETTVSVPACFDIGDWPFFNCETNSWQTRKNQKVTPSYSVTMMFHPDFKYFCPAYLLEHHIKEPISGINPVLPIFQALQQKIEIKDNDFDRSLYLYEEIFTLNSFLKSSIYNQYKLSSLDPFQLSIEFAKIKTKCRTVFSLLRQILLVLLCSFFEKQKKLDPLIEDDFIGLISRTDIQEQFPIIERYNHLIRTVVDVDNCLKHEFLERTKTNETLDKPGIKLVKLNRRKHYSLWNIPKKNLDLIDYNRKEFWTYSVEYDALITEFSRFLCDFLGINDPETERRPPVFFQIQENWSLSDTLPLEANLKKK